MVITISGIPGAGKNVLATYLARKHYKKYNSLIRRTVRKILGQEIWVNNVYTTYPIRLKKYSKRSKKKDVYSNKVTMYDLVLKHRFRKHACIIIDETQAFWDSEEHQDFPKEIAVFNQFHRHLDIDDIYYISQHPSRILKKICVIASELDKIKTFIKIPFIGIGFMHVVRYFEREDYGKYNHPAKETKTYDVENKYFFFRTKKVFESYDSKYLKVLNKDAPLFDKGTFTSLSLTKDEIMYIYPDLFKDKRPQQHQARRALLQGSYR